MSSSALSRRELVAGGVALAAGGLFVLGSPADAAAEGPADASAIHRAVLLEQTLAVGYTELARHPPLGRVLRDLLAHLADHEIQHAAALSESVALTPPPLPTLVQVETVLPGVRTSDRGTVLGLLGALERAEVATFSADQQLLTDTKLIDVVGAVMCSDAQHLALVREAAGGDPIPTAFETGKVR